MERQNAEKSTTEYLKPIYAFAVRHCKTLEDAEDLSQEIILKVFNALIKRDDIENESKFIWTIAHNCLCNYYRNTKSVFVGLPFEELADTIPHNTTDLSDDLIMQETINKLQSEIAYLSKLQRKIVIAYYYENKKQKDIAVELDIPIGTVKWHLFEAKKELKKGMEAMRNYGELKFNPVKFTFFGFNGTVGKSRNVLDSVLAQNIEYCVFREAKSINQIAEELGVSPVYIESEVEKLVEYSFLLENNNKYLCNILINEPSDKSICITNEMYTKAAKIFANELYEELINSDILDDIMQYGGYSDVTLDAHKHEDKNFFLWALIPYIVSLSGSELHNASVSYEEAAVYRSDGSHNICWATILNKDYVRDDQREEMKKFFGPCYQSRNDITLWRIDTKWSGERIDLDANERAFELISEIANDTLLSKIDYAFLNEQGYICTNGEPEKEFKSAFRCVYINAPEINEALLSIGSRIKARHWQEFEELKKPYTEEILKETPSQLLKMQKYGLQWIYYGDAPFILHCLNELVAEGKLTPPGEEQKKSLHTIIINNKK